MNLGDVMRELGLGSLVPDAGPNDEDETDAEADDATEGQAAESPDGTDGGGTESATAPATEPEPDPQPRRTFEGGEFEGDVGDAIEELQYELDDVRGRVDSNETSMEAVRNDQDRLEERVDGIEETNATLLGIYDRLTEGINPFSGSSANRDDATPDDGTYGVMSGEASDDALESADDGEDVVSFSDLKDAHDESEDETVNTDDQADDEESQETDHEPVRESVPTPPEPGTDTAESPYLSTLAPTYATDVLLMEWVAMLVETAGPAGALKTVDYYAQINWISPTVKRQLETVLSGAYDVDEAGPSRPPSDLPVEAHNESFEHIQRLAQQTELVEA